MNRKSLQYEANEGEIVILSWSMPDCYELTVHSNREDAIHDLWSAKLINHVVVSAEKFEQSNEETTESVEVIKPRLLTNV